MHEYRSGALTFAERTAGSDSVLPGIGQRSVVNGQRVLTVADHRLDDHVVTTRQLDAVLRPSHHFTHTHTHTDLVQRAKLAVGRLLTVDASPIVNNRPTARRAVCPQTDGTDTLDKLYVD